MARVPEKSIKELVQLKEYVETHNETNVVIAHKMDVSRTTVQRIKNENTKKMKAIGDIWREYKNNLQEFLEKTDDEIENIFKKYFKKDQRNHFSYNDYKEDELNPECLKCIKPEEILKITFGNQKIAWANIIKIGCILKMQPNIMIKSVADYLGLSGKTIARIRYRQTEDYQVIDKFIEKYSCENICKMSIKEIHHKLFLEFFNDRYFPGAMNVSEENLNKLFDTETINFIKSKVRKKRQEYKKKYSKPKKVKKSEDVFNVEEMLKFIFNQDKKDLKEKKAIVKKRNVKILGTYKSSDTIKKLAEYYGCTIHKKSILGDRYFDNIIENSKYQRI